MQTLEIIKVGWPLVVGLVAVVLWLGSVFHLSRQLRKEFDEFLQIRYSEDKLRVEKSFEKVKQSSEATERHLEDKLDKMAEKNEANLQKLYDKLNTSHILLAELKGRLQGEKGVTQ